MKVNNEPRESGKQDQKTRKHGFNIQAADDSPCEGGKTEQLAVLINLVSDSKTNADSSARCWGEIAGQKLPSRS